VIKPGVLPLAVRLQRRRVRDAQLLGEVVDHLRQNVRRVVQEHPEEPHRGHLHREPEPVVCPPLRLDQRPVHVV